MSASQPIQNPHGGEAGSTPSKLDLASEGASNGLWEWEPTSGRYLERGLWRVGLGYSQDQAATTFDAILSRIHPDERADFNQALLSVAHGQEKQFDITHRQRCRDGDYRWIATHGQAVERSTDGEITLVAGSHVDVSKLKEMEAELARKEADLDLVLESSNQCNWEWNTQDNSLSLPRSWHELFGYSEADVTAGLNNIAGFAHPDEADTAQAALIKALKGKTDLYDIQQRMRHKDGHYLHCLVRARVVERDDNGRAIRISGMTTDISALKNTEQALHESTSRLNFALESAQHAIWEWHPLTDKYTQSGYLGCLDESELGVPITSGAQLIELTHPDDRDNIHRTLVHYLRGETAVYSVDQRIRMQDGSYRIFLSRAQAMERGSDGYITRIIGTHTDITDVKANHQRLELALKHGRQGLAEWKPDQDSVEFSDSWYALYGYKKGDFKNFRHDVIKKFHPDDIDSVRAALIKMLKGTDDEFSVEYRFKCKDGSYLWSLLRAVIVERDAEGRASLVVGTYVDIHRQKMVELELLESRRFLKLVLDTIPDLVYWKDIHSRYLGANRQFALNAGFSDASEIVGKSDYDLPWAEHAATYQAEDNEVMRSGAAKKYIDRTFTDAHGTQHLDEKDKVPLFDESQCIIGVLVISKKVTQERQREKQLEKLAECITSDGAGRLLDALLNGAAELSGIATAFIAKIDPKSQQAIVTATYPHNSDSNGRSYVLDGTICADAIKRDACIYPDNVQASFPNDKALAHLGIIGYVGKRLLDRQNQVIGIVALQDTKPLQDPKYATSVLDIIAASASAELQREQREIELIESEERYRTTYDNVPVMICTVDDTDRISDINNAWIEATGYTGLESVGTNLASYFTPDSRDIYLVLSQEDFDPSIANNPTLDFVCKDGLVIKVAHSATRTVSPDGVPVTITLLEDVTTRLVAEQQLRLAATAFETHEALVIRDSRKRILRVNTAFKNITGYADSDVIGKSPKDFNLGNTGTFEVMEIWSSVDESGEWDGELINCRADGSTFSVWQTITAVRDDNGEITHYVENFTDVSELKQALADAEQLALYDPLTELPNRRYLMEQLESNISQSRRHGGTGALLFIDLDQFKHINDSLGHAVGDALLIQVAKRLTRLMRQEDTIARLGGDEFVVVLPKLGREISKCVDQARRVAEKIHIELGKTYEVENHELNITPTIGVTLFPEHGKTVETILQEADSAMYQGKADGRNVTKFFHPSIQSEAQARLSLERDLRTATERGELDLYFQPQYNRDGDIFAAEALLRWHHPTRGFVPPSVFIPIAEESGLIIHISQWMFARAVESLRRWERDGALFLEHLAINVSSRQFRSPNLVHEITREILSAAVPANRIVIEVTESTVIENFEETARKMEELRDIGIRFSVDDFGVGYSSLSYLSRLPLDQLKIDRSFVTNVLQEPSDTVIAETIIGMGSNLQLQTIAEGVETETQLNFLREHGCDGFQGYLFSKPVPESEFLLLDRRWSGAVGQ